MKKTLLMFLLVSLFVQNELNAAIQNKEQDRAQNRNRNGNRNRNRNRSSTRSQHKSHAKSKKKVQIMVNPGDLRLKDKGTLIKLGEQYLKKLLTENNKQTDNYLWFRVRFITDQGVEESVFQKKPYYFSGSNFYFTEEGQSKRGIIKGMDILKAITNGHDNIKQGLCCERVKDIKKFVLNNTDFQGYCFQVVLYNDEWSLCHENKDVLNDFRLVFRANIVKEYQKKYGIGNPGFLQDPYVQIGSKYGRRRRLK